MAAGAFDERLGCDWHLVEGCQTGFKMGRGPWGIKTMPRSQILVHLRNNPGFSLDNLVHLESFLCDQDGLRDVEFDGHDHGANDSNLFIFSDELDNTAGLIARVIKARWPDLNFAVGAKAKGVETDYGVLASKGIDDIILQ